jgi:hypothetical protein
VRWVNMGDGNVDIDGWIQKFMKAKPGLPIIFENLVSANPRIHRIYDTKFWDNWRRMPASELSHLLAVAEKGTPKPATPRPEGKTAGQQRIEDLEVCVKYTRARHPRRRLLRERAMQARRDRRRRPCRQRALRPRGRAPISGCSG